MKLAVSTPTQFGKVKLTKIGKVERGELVVGPNDVIISSQAIPGIRDRQSSNLKNWETMLNFCTFVEALILNDNVILELPSDEIKLAANPARLFQPFQF